MNSITSLFQQAQLAEAAYADFASGLSTKDALIANKFSSAQATEFVKHWTVVNQYTAPSGLFGVTDGTGFSATLFQNKDTRSRGQVLPFAQSLRLTGGFPCYNPSETCGKFNIHSPENLTWSRG